MYVQSVGLRPNSDNAFSTKLTDSRQNSGLNAQSNIEFNVLGMNRNESFFTPADGETTSHIKATRVMADTSNRQLHQNINGVLLAFDKKLYPHPESSHCYPSHQPRQELNLRIQPPRYYNNPPNSSMFPSTFSPGSSSTTPYFSQNSTYASQYNPDLSSSFVSTPFTSSNFPSRVNKDFINHSTAVFNLSLPDQPSENLCHSVVRNNPGFVSSVSPPIHSAGPSSSGHLLHSKPTTTTATNHHLYPRFSPSTFQPAPVAHTPPRSFVSNSNHLKIPTSNTKRSLQTFSSSSSSGSKSHQILFSLPTKYPKPTLVLKKPGLFDHRQLDLRSDEPFSLENSLDLESPSSIVFPCAKQESDPDFNIYPISLELFNSQQEKMTSQKFNGKPSNASNHNLVGHKIDDGRLELMSVLGLGAYGVVYLARDLTSPDMENPKFYAVKALNKIGLDARQKAFQRREIALHSLASSHASIVTLHAVIESPSCLFVILDYCPDGDLFGMITEKQKYLGKNEAIRCVFVQIIEAVQFCHRLGISHRDLKPENILCKKDGDEVVLADFGLATAERTSTDFGCGSTFYMSPECQGGLFQKLGCYSTIHNDIWSLGVILVNLTCGRNPWKQACPSDETFKAYLSNPEFLRSILPISLPLNQLLKRIFSLNPLGRISLEDMKAQVLKIKNFNMTAEELSKSTRATREAARAWFPDVPPSPKPLSNAEASSWKSNFAKKAKKQSRNKNDDGEHVSRNQLDANGDVWKQDVRYEETSSSSCATTVINDSTDSTFWTMNNQRPGPHQQRLWKQLKSPFHVLHSSRDSEQSYKNRFFGSQNATSKAQHHPTSQRKDEASSAQVPTGPLVTAFTSASISNSSSSSSSSNERVAKPRGFSARFVGPLKQSVSPNRDSGSPNSGTRKKILAKPMVFNRPNAPAPIILKPCTPESSGSSTSSRSRGLITPTNKKGKHSTLTFLPSTPPSSASPSSSTFGFIKKSAKKFPFSSHSELPPTPSTPSHPGKEPVSPTTHQRKVRSPAPISIRKCDDMKKISFINCCSDDEDEHGSGADADFELDDDDEEERRLHKNKVTAHREAALRNVYPAIYVSESGQ